MEVVSIIIGIVIAGAVGFLAGRNFCRNMLSRSFETAHDGCCRVAFLHCQEWHKLRVSKQFSETLWGCPPLQRSDLVETCCST